MPKLIGFSVQLVQRSKHVRFINATHMAVVILNHGQSRQSQFGAVFLSSFNGAPFVSVIIAQKVDSFSVHPLDIEETSRGLPVVKVTTIQRYRHLFWETNPILAHGSHGRNAPRFELLHHVGVVEEIVEHQNVVAMLKRHLLSHGEHHLGAQLFASIFTF